jgi:hypothetical protein
LQALYIPDPTRHPSSMLERTRNTVARQRYEVIREGRPEAAARFRRRRDAEHEACVRARFDRAGRHWLVIRMKRDERVEVVRRVRSGPAGGGNTCDGGAGDRFPRRPLRPLGAGSVELPLPD